MICRCLIHHFFILFYCALFFFSFFADIAMFYEKKINKIDMSLDY